MTGSFFCSGFGASTVFAISAFDGVFVSDLSYLVSFLEDLEALRSILSDVLTFFSGEGSFLAMNLARFPFGSTGGETFLGYDFLDDDLRLTFYIG